jgi:preprotein translocase subunit SecG
LVVVVVVVVVVLAVLLQVQRKGGVEDLPKRVRRQS